MTLLEEIRQLLDRLPPEKQSEVLDFIEFIYQRTVTSKASKRSLKKHPAFGSWKNRNVDAVQYQRDLRAEWDSQ